MIEGVPIPASILSGIAAASINRNTYDMADFTINQNVYKRSITIMTKTDNNVDKNVKLINSMGNDELRNLLLAKTLTAIDEMEYKIIGNGRIANPDNEKIRVTYLKGIINGCNVAARILKDKNLSDLEDEIRMLKKGLLQDEDRPPVVSDEAINEIERLNDKIDALKTNE